MRSLPENSATKRSGSGWLGERDRRQPQSRRPPFGALLEQRHAGVRKPDAGRLQQLSGLLQREAQIGLADLRQSARQPQPVQPEARVLAGDQHDQQLRRQPGQEVLEQLQRLLRAKLVQIVDHQGDRLVEQVQTRQQPVDDRLAVEGRRSADPLHQPVLTDGAGELVDDRQPEVLGIALATCDGHPGGPIGQPLGLDPGPQQHGLAAACGRAREDHFARAGGCQPVEQQPARHHPASGRQALRVAALR